jgi:hypothetical protein
VSNRTSKRATEVIRLPTNNRLVRYKKDAVGNDLTAVLRWCDTHSQPVGQYDDDSYECPHTLIVQVDTRDHVIVDAPWELSDPAVEGGTP